MQTTTPLLSKITNILQTKLNRLPQHVRTRLSVLKDMCLATLRAFLPEPVVPPVKKVPPTPGRPSRPKTHPPQPGAAKPPSLPHPRPQPPLPQGQRPNASGTAADDLDEDRPTTILGIADTTDRKVWLSLRQRFQGVYCIGAAGVGKSVLLLNMILSDIRLGRGVCLIEPHGDQSHQVIAAMPAERLKDVIYLDITDNTASFSLNFFEAPVGADITEVAKIASFVMHVFEKVWAVGPETPRLQMVLRNITRVLIENPGMTFAEIGLLLWDDGVREKLVRRVSNTQTKLFWSQYNRLTPHDRSEQISSTINKCDSYLNELLIARIVSQSASSISFRELMDEGKILLVNLSPQLEEASRLIGAVIIGRLLMAAFSRTDTPSDKRRPFMIYADEYQRFATSDFATFLAEARKFKIATTISNQVLEQLDDVNRATALQAGSLVVFRVSGEDSKELAPSFDTTPTPALVGEEPVRVVVADPLTHLARHGHPNTIVAKFVSDYIMALTSLLKSTASSPHAFGLGCAIVHPDYVIQGHRQLNEAFATCMREGNAAVCISPLALFILAAASDQEMTYVFFKDLRYSLGIVYFQGFYGASESFGKADFLSPKHEQEDKQFLRKMAKSIWVSRATVEHRVAAFTRMLKALRHTLEILAKDPLLTDTGLFQPKYQLRSYQDQENSISNELSQLPNYTAKVRLLSGEYTINTRPAPAMVSEQEVAARIKAIKQRMLRDGVTRPALEIEEEVRKRHETLRSRPASDAPPSDHPTGKRRSRNKPQPPDA